MIVYNCILWCFIGICSIYIVIFTYFYQITRIIFPNICIFSFITILLCFLKHFFFQFFRNTLPLSIVEIISHITMIQNIGMEGLEIKQITTQLIGKKNLACIFTKVLLQTHKNSWNWNDKRAKKYFPDFKYFIFFL